MSRVTLRRAGSAAFTVLTVLLVAVFVVQAAPGVVGAEESYVVLSSSMEPTISPGDVVIVSSVAPGDVSAGDVITFRRGGESTPVTHRVIEVVERDGSLAFRTKGDANEDADPTPVPARNLVGEVWFVIPFVGHVVAFANTKLGMLVLVALPVLAFAASELYAFARRDSGVDATAADGDDPLTETLEPAVSNSREDGDAASTESDASNASAGGRGVEGGDADGSDAVQVTATDVRLSAVGFAALAVYSGYVAYTNPSPVSVAVFAGAALVVAFVAVLLASGTDAPADAPAASRTDGGETQTADATGGGDDA